jgi:hypothetical protein
MYSILADHVQPSVVKLTPSEISGVEAVTGKLSNREVIVELEDEI